MANPTSSQEKIASPALNARDLQLSFNQTQVLKQFSLNLNQGEILCLLGPSGCGKTTALKTIAGLHQADHGSIELFGQTVVSDSVNLPPQQRQIGFIFQDYALFPHMTVAKNIAYGLIHLSKQQQSQRIQEVLALVELSELAERYPHELSGGQQQRIAVARALAPKPKLLLMDEPFSNVDTQVKRRMMADLRQLLKNEHISCIFVTHAKDEAFAFADKTAVMIDGVIRQLDSPRNVFQKPKDDGVARFMESGNICSRQEFQQVVSHAATAGNGDPEENSKQYLLRPHNIVLTEDVDGCAEVIDSQFDGRSFQLCVRIDALDRTIWTVESQQPPRQSGNPTTRVSLSYSGTPHPLESA